MYLGIGLLLVIVLLKVGPLFPFKIYTVITGSMSPTYEAGSLIIVRQADGTLYSAGDILAYQSGDEGMLITHRIMEVLQDDEGINYITRGDANNINDLRPVSQKQAVGRVVFWLNGLGKALIFIRTTKGILSVLSVTLLLISASYLWDMQHKKTEPSQND